MKAEDTHRAIEKAAEAICNAKVLLITCGAGMGVDSGLPDFRGNEGFWRAYPPYRTLGRSFVDCANPQHFATDPAFAWGFYGHRTELYRKTTPHLGFTGLQQIIDTYKLKAFVITSNVDGQLQKAGFSPDRILEVHGSIHSLQCSRPCNESIWPNRSDFKIDNTTMRADDWPICPQCHDIARPNILMFNDGQWLSHQTSEQQKRFTTFLAETAGLPRVIVELGAGTSVPTIRHLSEQLANQSESTLVRINPTEPHTPPGGLSIPSGALKAIKKIRSCQPISTP